MKNSITYLHLSLFAFLRSIGNCIFFLLFTLIVAFLFFEYIGQITSTEVVWNENLISPILGNIHFLLLITIPILTYSSASTVFKLEGQQLCRFLGVSTRKAILIQFLVCLFQVVILHLIILTSASYLFFLGYDDWKFFLNLFFVLFSISIALLSICFFVRSKIKNPLIYMFCCFGMICFFYLINLAGNFLSNYVLIEVFKSLSFSVIFDNAISGSFSIKKLLYLLSLTISFLYFSIFIPVKNKRRID